MRLSIRKAVVVVVALITPCALIFAQPATQPATTAPAISDAAFVAALEAADGQPVQNHAFEQILQSVSPRFPLVSVSTEAGQPAWQKVTLNRRGKQVDAFRIRVPDGEPRDLFWVFLCNDLRYEWQIIPAAASEGRMGGFRRNWYYKPQDILGDRVPGPSKDLVLQSLDAASFKPGCEYLIWFKFRHAKPMPMYVAITFLPAAADPMSIESSSHIASAMGLSRAGGQIAEIAKDVNPTTRPARKK